jgi:hypothetical protein
MPITDTAKRIAQMAMLAGSGITEELDVIVTVPGDEVKRISSNTDLRIPRSPH